MGGKKTKAKSSQVHGEDSPDRGAFMPTGCAEHVAFLQGEVKLLRAALAETQGRAEALRHAVGKCYSTCRARSAQLQLRAQSELEILQRVARQMRGLMAQALVDGELLVQGAPGYADENDTTKE